MSETTKKNDIDKIFTLKDQVDINILKKQRREQIRLSFKRFFSNKLAVIGGAIVLFIIVIAIFANVFSPFDPFKMEPMEARVELSSKHPMGTDEFGRDYMSRVFYGARISIQVGLISTSVATLFGILIGGIAGFYGKMVDIVLMRIMDAILSFPTILLAIVLVAILGPSALNAMLAIGIIYIPIFARVVRSAVLANKEADYIEAARAVGKSNFRILFVELIPNCLSPIIVQATVTFADAIIIEAGLSFLGLSAQPPIASWGKMLNEAMEFMRTTPSLAIFPGAAISLTVLGFNLLGDGLRDVLDPRLRRGGL